MTMDSVSVSKGCFVFKNGFRRTSKKQKKQDVPKPFFELQFHGEIWYKAYKNCWVHVENQIEKLHTSTYNRILKDLVCFIKECYNNQSTLCSEIIPCATLLTGINQPDHIVQFTALKDQLLCEVTSHVAIIYSQDANSVKQMIENMIMQFMNDESEDTDSDDDEKSINKYPRVKKSQCNMGVLSSWFKDMYNSTASNILSPSKKLKSASAKNHLVVIIPDFESFNNETLQDFILILSGYTCVLPFVLVFGVATSVSALHKSFPYQISSRLLVQVFQSHSSTNYLNQVLEKIFLNENCPFHLSGKVFKLLMDVFLFYDFSVTGFIQSLKFCMMEHYYATKINALCCPRQQIPTTISQFTKEDLEAVRQLPSFRPYVEANPASIRISLLQSDDYLKIDLGKAIENLHNYLHDFHISLKILLSIVGSLPNVPLGKQLRELYTACISSSVVESDEYRQCLLLISFQSKDEFLDVIKKSVSIVEDSSPLVTITNTPRKRHLLVKKSQESSHNNHQINVLALKDKLMSFKEKIKNASLEYITNNLDNDHDVESNEKLNRQTLKQQLLKASNKEKQVTEFELVRNEVLKYLTEEVFGKHLLPPSTQPFHELFFFSNVYKVKRHIVGTPRASIHTALNNPSAYLQCKCCDLSNSETILPSLPDLSIAYKLHLECGKLINLYDWLQAFLTIVDPVESNDDDDDRREVHPAIQARFTKSVSELQFLGFIKTSKRKTDHVSRLTW